MRLVNPNGIPAQLVRRSLGEGGSPGLRGTRYPGKCGEWMHKPQRGFGLWFLLFTALVLALIGLPLHAQISLLPEKIPCAIPDKQEVQIPDRVILGGWIGTRLTANESNRLAA